MAADPEQPVYERELRIAARPETVFDLLTEPEAFASWMGEEVVLDPTPGGAFRVLLGRGTISGEVRVVEPGRRVAFTWGWEDGVIPLAPGASLVEFTLIPDGEDTILRLEHSGLTPRLREFHDWGWSAFLPRLVAVAEGRDPGADPMTPGAVEQAVARLLAPDR